MGRTIISRYHDITMSQGHRMAEGASPTFENTVGEVHSRSDLTALVPCDIFLGPSQQALSDHVTSSQRQEMSVCFWKGCHTVIIKVENQIAVKMFRMVSTKLGQWPKF